MTKKEIIALLNDKYKATETGISRMNLKELEELLAKYEGLEKDSKEVNVTKKTETKKKASILSTEEVQLGIYETVIRRFNPTVTIDLKNLGAGDLYINESGVNVISEENKIQPGESVKMDDVSIVYMTSSSRPKIKINYIR